MTFRSGFITAAILLFVFSCGNQNEQDKSSGKLINSELDYRQELIQNRIFFGDVPKITSDFLLAGLTLDPQFERRFTNYSGDQEGRYLSAVSLVDIKDNPIDIHKLVEDIAKNQKADGRFGADTLIFKAEAMEGPQMALLWGNGRLLTGLVDYYNEYPDKTIALETAKRLGDFLIGVTDAATQPQVIKRFQTMGALGFICLTQITEGMVKLYNHTGEEKFIKVAEKIYPLLPAFGNQHSHGYLNTLRGVVMLYEATKNPAHLAYAENIFEQIIASENYMITGGLPEFFSFTASVEGTRDEGCSEADFLMFLLQLWKATDKTKYLDYAEYLLVNHMLYNQYQSGDFGHHPIEHDFGFRVATIQAKSWWCCNYHGLHALIEAKHAIFTTDDSYVKVNLYYPAEFKGDNIQLTMDKDHNINPIYSIKVNKVNDITTRISLRNPYWSEAAKVSLNNRLIEVREEKGYLFIDRELEEGDQITIEFKPVVRFVTNEKKEFNISKLPAEPVFAAMIYGPWLMTIDDVYEPLFMAELSSNNIIYVGDSLIHVNQINTAIPENSFNPETYLTFNYKHEGFYQVSNVTMRPLSETTFQPPANVRYWFYFAKKE